ncbi:MAG: sigma-54 factor interaction domain-containing protein, partial [Planctomycetota bacterium]
MKQHLSPLARAILDADYARVRAITDDLLLRQVSDGEKKSYRAIRATVDALDHILPVDQALPTLREAIDCPPEDPELFFLLLGMGTHLSSYLRHKGDAQRFSRLMKTLLDDTSTAEMKAFWLLNEFFQHYAVSNYSDGRALLNEALSLDIPRDTGFWVRLKYNRVNLAITEMDFSTAENNLADIAPLIPHHPHFATSLQLLKIHLHRSIGNTDEALTILATTPSSGRTGLAQLLHFTLLFDTKRWEDYDRELAALEKSPIPNFPPEYILLCRSWKALGQNDLGKARELAHEAISPSKTNLHPHHVLSDSIRILASVELSLRNPKSARTLLEMIDPHMTMLNLAIRWMQLLLLENNEPQAAVFLKRILDIERYGARILALELREAHEVTGHQMEKLRLLVSQMHPSPHTPTASPSEPVPLPTLLGENPAIRKAKTLIRKYAPLDTTVLITGETGTGKDVAARLIHESSSRAGHPFIAVNCASISDSLMEAELFGYVKGSFTGASSNHDGLFTTAGKGTLFLDDVESMPARLQAGLLRVLESGEIRPVGGTRTRKTTARIVAATNIPLDELVKKGTFREDLLYRLARFEITLPPLRERKDDIPILAKHFLKKIYASHPEGPP